MQLPKQLEALRERKIWLCYPLIWNETKHGGVGGYDKPPVNPYTLTNARSNDSSSLATFAEAAAQIGKKAHVITKGHEGLYECEIAGVGVAFSGTGVCGLDLDNVVNRERKVMTREAGEIIELLDSYTEISPSGTGLHVIFTGKLPEDIKKLAKNKRDIFKTELAEYQLFDSGYMTISGEVVGDHELGERTDQVVELYEKYFKEVEPIEKLSTRRPAGAPSVVSSSSGYSYERWLEEVKRLSDKEVLERIFESGSTGKKVKALYNGDMSEYNNDHSRADQALCTFLYGFTSDRTLTERVFRSSALFRASGKSKKYLEHTLNKAEKDCTRLVGHIEFTDEEKKAYAQKKELEEDTREAKRLGYPSVEAYRARIGSALRERAKKSTRSNSYREETSTVRRNSYRGNN